MVHHSFTVTRPPSNAVWQRLLRLLAPQWPSLLGAVLAAALASAAAASWASLLGPLLLSVVSGQAHPTGWLSRLVADRAELQALAVVSFAIVKAIGTLVAAGLGQRAAQRTLNALRKTLYWQILHAPTTVIARQHSGNVLSLLINDVAALEFSVGQALTSWLKDSLLVAGLLVQCALLDVRLFLLTFIVLPAMLIPLGQFAKFAKRALSKQQGVLAQLTVLVSETFTLLPIIQAYRMEHRAQAQLESVQRSYLTAMRRSLFVRGAFTPTTELIGITGLAIGLVWGAKAIDAEPQLAGRLLSFVTAALLLYQPVKSIAGTFSQSSQGLAAATRLFDFIESATPPPAGVPVGILQQRVTFSSVDFAYQSDRKTLDDVSFEIARGEMVALVGTTGAGKSTIAALALKFIEPTSGAIFWDDTAFSACDAASLRQRLAWVPQEPVLLTGTIRDNVTLGHTQASEAEVWQALVSASAEPFVKGLPLGLDTPVGERGLKLSGGQRQRIAIARAFLVNPSLLILDEPTSALDSINEEEIEQAVARLQAGRATLLIAHRLKTVERATHILMLDNGKIVERGTHQTLMALNGRYAALVAHSKKETSPKSLATR